MANAVGVRVPPFAFKNMKAELTDVSECRKNLEIEIPQEVVDHEITHIAQEFARRARVPGFRPGKAPIGVIKTRFRDEIVSEMMQHLMPKYFGDAVDERKLEIVQAPHFESVDYNSGQALRFKAVFEVYPKLNVSNYVGVPVDEVASEVGDTEVEASLKKLQEDMDFRGDPSAALLEVLDPEQNSTFQDHYLDVEYDLSQVMFIATANVLHTIPQPLQDRMETLRLPGYTEYEKIEIARRFLVPKQLEANGLKAQNVCFTDEGIQGVIQHYTREAGVRNLEREISSICRKVTRAVVKDKSIATVTITGENVVDYIGIPKYRSNRHESQNEVGFVTGLAWTEVGGEILATEATLMEGKGQLTLTGKLGDVMQESAQAAMSYVRSRAQRFGIPKDFYRRLDLHIHVPEGAIPKDGPSAGITMATSLVSALTQIPVRGDVAMTGEITLRGKVLPIGGVKEKLLAAHRAGIRTIILPKDNQKDLAEIPPNIKGDFTVHLVENMDEVLKIALAHEPTPLMQEGAEVAFPAPIGTDGDLQESIMH